MTFFKNVLKDYYFGTFVIENNDLQVTETQITCSSIIFKHNTNLNSGFIIGIGVSFQLTYP